MKKIIGWTMLIMLIGGLIGGLCIGYYNEMGWKGVFLVLGCIGAAILFVCLIRVAVGLIIE